MNDTNRTENIAVPTNEENGQTCEEARSTETVVLAPRNDDDRKGIVPSPLKLALNFTVSSRVCGKFTASSNIEVVCKTSDENQRRASTVTYSLWQRE